MSSPGVPAKPESELHFAPPVHPFLIDIELLFGKF